MTNFNLWKHHGMNPSETESLMPYERDVYVLMLLDLMEKEKENQLKNR